MNQNNFFQSQFVPAEKPYNVYCFVWEGPYTAVAQLIGTMITGTIDENGIVKYTTNGVFRFPSNRMLAFDHCFIEGHSGVLITDLIHQLGHVGDTVGLEALCEVSWMDQRDSDDCCYLKYLINMIKESGLTLDLDVSKLRVQKGSIKREYLSEMERNVPCLVIHDQIALLVNLAATKSAIISKLARKLQDLEEIGIRDFRVQMEDATQQACYDELIEVTKLYISHYEKPEGTRHCDILILLMAREAIGTNQCTPDEFCSVLSKDHYLPQEIEDYIESGLKNRLITQDGDVIRFCDDIERMISWEPACNEET